MNKSVTLTLVKHWRANLAVPPAKFDSRWRRTFFQTSAGLHCTLPFIIILLSSCHPLDMTELQLPGKDVKLQVIHHPSSKWCVVYYGQIKV